jgi:hypothetical protein
MAKGKRGPKDKGETPKKPGNEEAKNAPPTAEAGAERVYSDANRGNVEPLEIEDLMKDSYLDYP